LDFRNVTDLFADKDFDGDPVRIKVAAENDDISNIEGEEEDNDMDITDETGETVEFEKPKVRYPIGNGQSLVNEPRKKVYVNGVDVTVLNSREMYFDQHGKPITTSLKDHTKEIITEHFATLQAFLNKWNETDRKEAIIKELEEQGVLVEALQNAVNKELDLFDLVCHVAYDQPPLTRKERANNVKKRNYFTKYGAEARKVLEALLDKYADEGITTIESTQVLAIDPLTDFGTPVEIIGLFGGADKYKQAVLELENELYQIA
jgi:type I restriction enzyme R subunit